MKSYLTSQNEKTSETESQQLAQHMLQNEVLTVNTFARSSFPIFIVSSLAMAILAPASLKVACTLPFIAFALINTCWSLYFRNPNRVATQGQMITLGAMHHTVGTVGFSFILNLAMTNPDLARGYLIMVGLLYGVLGVLINIANPASAVVNIIFTICHVTSGIIIWHLSGYPYLLTWALLLGLSNTLGLSNFLLQARRSRSHALIEIRSKALDAQNRELTQKAMESDLALARQMQRSLAPPPETLRSGSFSLHFYHVAHGPLGGDWSATRVLNDGTIIIAVGDVTGKGIPAAMVVQAVQALWAHSLSQPNFVPETWINSVNQTLLMMGKREAHTLTLGVLVLEKLKMTYYSAGHIPVMMRSLAVGASDIRLVQGIGNILGLQESSELTPAVIHFDPLREESILIGSDGILGWELRRHKKLVMNLFDDLNTTGKPNFNAIPVTDDQTLVWVEYAPLSELRSTERSAVKS